MIKRNNQAELSHLYRDDLGRKQNRPLYSLLDDLGGEYRL
jgi:hypothetical protein